MTYGITSVGYTGLDSDPLSEGYSWSNQWSNDPVDEYRDDVETRETFRYKRTGVPQPESGVSWTENQSRVLGVGLANCRSHNSNAILLGHASKMERDPVDVFQDRLHGDLTENVKRKMTNSRKSIDPVKTRTNQQKLEAVEYIRRLLRCTETTTILAGRFLPWNRISVLLSRRRRTTTT